MQISLKSLKNWHSTDSQTLVALHHVQKRALANLINTFLETACKEKFQHNQYHEALFKYYILEENIQKLDIPPYFRGDFFPAIRRIYKSPLNINKISLRQIYRFLVEEVTMIEKEDSSNEPLTLIPLKAELTTPSNQQWEQTWKMARMKMLGPILTSFMFKLLHKILPTAERVSRILPKNSPICTKCDGNVPETIQHAVFDCHGNHQVGQVLLTGLSKYLPNLTPIQILTLNLDTDEDQEFSMVWSIASFLSSLWHLRQEKKRIDLVTIRSEMEATCRLLSSASKYPIGPLPCQNRTESGPIFRQIRTKIGPHYAQNRTIRHLYTILHK